MARTKSPAIRREPSEIHIQSNGVVHRDGYGKKEVSSLLDEKLVSDSSAAGAGSLALKDQDLSQPGLGSLIFSVGGIYMSLYVNIYNLVYCDD
jgi:hypothetical protein